MKKYADLLHLGSEPESFGFSEEEEKEVPKTENTFISVVNENKRKLIREYTSNINLSSELVNTISLQKSNLRLEQVSRREQAAQLRNHLKFLKIFKVEKTSKEREK